jgi:RNA polymerase sigma-70 factor (ECF subfamily)
MESLIQKILDGDEQAVVSFYHQYSPRIMRFLKTHLPKDEDAQEILNDVFLEAVDGMPTLHKHTNLQAWLYKIASNKTADFYRKRKIKSFLFSQLPYLEIIAQEISQPEFQLEKKKMKEQIEAALRSLSENYQRVLSMHYEEQIPVKLIAQEFNLSFKATESLLFRARQSFILAYERA